MAYRQIITISNAKARWTTRRYQNRLQRLSRQHSNIHHFETSCVEDISGVLDEVRDKFSGECLDFVKVSGDGGLHYLVTALAQHPLLEEYELPTNGYCFPERITVSPTGHGTQNVLARYADVKARRVLSSLSKLAAEGSRDTVDVELMRFSDDERSLYGFMFTAGETLHQGSVAYHEGRFGAFSLVTLIAKSALSLTPVFRRIPFLRRHRERIFDADNEVRISYGGEDHLGKHGVILASAENLRLGPLYVWQKEEGKTNLMYGSVTGLGQGLKAIIQMALNRPVEMDGVTNAQVEGFSLHESPLFSVDDEWYRASGTLEASLAGKMRIPKTLTTRK